MRDFVCLLLCALGLTLTLGYPVLWPLGWVALWPLFAALDGAPGWKKRALLGAGLTLLVSQTGFPYAIATAYHHLGGNRPLAAWAMGTTLGVVTSIRYFVFCLLATPGSRGWGWAATWCAAELWIWQMMPVYGALHVQGDVPFAQLAEWVGTPGLTFLWFGCSLAAFDAWRKRFSVRGPAVALLLLHLLGAGLWAHWAQLSEKAPAHRVAVVQGNQPPALAATEQQAIKSRGEMLSQTADCLQGFRAEAVVWPEASLPLVTFSQLAAAPPPAQKLPELFFVDSERDAEGQYVTARCIDEAGKTLASYRKRRLIFMGEWTPWARPENLSIGHQDVLLPSDLGPALPLVCFEGLWPGFTASFHRNTGGKARWLCHMGSESSFGSPLACRQSLQLARPRAVELRRPVVRADNSGVSGWIDVTGELHDATTPFEKANLQLMVKIPESDSLTLYAALGDVPVSCAVLAGGLIVLRRRLRKPGQAERQVETA